MSVPSLARLQPHQGYQLPLWVIKRFKLGTVALWWHLSVGNDGQESKIKNFLAVEIVHKKQPPEVWDLPITFPSDDGLPLLDLFNYLTLTTIEDYVWVCRRCIVTRLTLSFISILD